MFPLAMVCKVFGSSCKPYVACTPTGTHISTPRCPKNTYFGRYELLETAKCLIAEDLGLALNDPQVETHLEQSQAFGSVLFPDEDEDE
jgi:hypothetical protein